MARNPSCGLLKGLNIAGVSPVTVVEAVYGDAPREGQSPFALAAGNRFESQLIGHVVADASRRVFLTAQGLVGERDRFTPA